MMPRQFLVMLALLACGLVPDRLLFFGWAEPARVRDRLRDDRLNRADYDRVEHRYYEQLIDSEFDNRLDRISSSGFAADSSARAPKVRAGLWSVSFDDSPLIERVDDLREIVFRPDGEVESDGVRWTTNSQGMRDRPYETRKPPGTFRIALVGDSIGAGWGVDAEARFESVLERRWDERSRGRGGPAVEIVNCAVPGHSPGQRWSHFTRIGLPMEPDLILYEATAADVDWDERRLRVLLARGIGWDSPLYREVLDRAGARPGGSYERYKRVLKPYRWDLLSGVYRAMASESRARGIPIVWILVPRVGRTPTAAEHTRLLNVARAAGFSHVVDVSDTFDGLDPDDLMVEPDDFHPNGDGHARLASRLDGKLSPIPEIRSVWDAPAELSPIPGRPRPRRDPSLVRASADPSQTKQTQPTLGADPR
jgi:lysophospholipase L1-like esterase